MSFEKHSKSTSIRPISNHLKVNHHSKLLPIDFFPKINSQSPKRKADFPAAKDLLVEWYERDESQDKPHRQYRRITQKKPSPSRISLIPIA